MTRKQKPDHVRDKAWAKKSDKPLWTDQLKTQVYGPRDTVVATWSLTVDILDYTINPDATRELAHAKAMRFVDELFDNINLVE